MLRDQAVEQMLDFLELYGCLARGEEPDDYVRARFLVAEMLKTFNVVEAKLPELKRQRSSRSSDSKSIKEEPKEAPRGLQALRGRMHLAMALIERKAGNFNECFKHIDLAKVHCSDKATLIHILRQEAQTKLLNEENIA